MTSGDDKLLSGAAAELADVKLSTWSSYVSRGQAPKPDDYYDRRTPWWYRSTVEDWKANRPGQGSRKHTSAKPLVAGAGAALPTPDLSR
jgi:hypothetical protein